MKTNQRFGNILISIFIILTAFFSYTIAAAQTSDSLVTATRTAADREHVFGLAGILSFPYGEFNDTYDEGLGLHAMLDYPVVSILNWTADVGFNHFATANDGEAITVMEYSMGMKAVFGWFFMGGETGYYSKVEEWSFVPTWGLKFGQFEFSMRTKAVGGGSWSGMRAGWYF